LIRTISRNIFNMKELEKMKVEKAVKSSNIEEQSVYIARQKLTDPEGLYLSSLLNFNDWLFPFDFVLFFGLLTNLGILRNIETSPDIWSSS